MTELIFLSLRDERMYPMATMAMLAKHCDHLEVTFKNPRNFSCECAHHLFSLKSSHRYRTKGGRKVMALMDTKPATREEEEDQGRARTCPPHKELTKDTSVRKGNSLEGF